MLSSCGTDDGGEANPDRGEDFYPLKEGIVRIYHVDSIVFNSFNQSIDTFRYQVRYRVGDTIGEREWLTYLMIRDIRSDSFHQWAFDAEQEVSVDDQFILERVNNEAFVKLTFPVKEFKTWDGNLYNSMDPETYSYEYVDTEFNGKYISSTSALKVLLRERLNELEEIKAEEVYARDLGLLYRNVTDKRSDQIGQEIPDGYECIYHLIETAD